MSRGGADVLARQVVPGLEERIMRWAARGGVCFDHECGGA